MVDKQNTDGSWIPAEPVHFYKGVFGRLFCKHRYRIMKWHFTHGPNGNEIRYIEGFKQCPLCGKEKYFWVERGSMLEKRIINEYADRQE